MMVRNDEKVLSRISSVYILEIKLWSDVLTQYQEEKKIQLENGQRP